MTTGQANPRGIGNRGSRRFRDRRRVVGPRQRSYYLFHLAVSLLSVVTFLLRLLPRYATAAIQSRARAPARQICRVPAPVNRAFFAPATRSKTIEFCAKPVQKLQSQIGRSISAYRLKSRSPSSPRFNRSDTRGTSPRYFVSIFNLARVLSASLYVPR